MAIGVQAFLTTPRWADAPGEETDRAAFANRTGADLFVSLAVDTSANATRAASRRTSSATPTATPGPRSVNASPASCSARSSRAATSSTSARTPRRGTAAPHPDAGGAARRGLPDQRRRQRTARDPDCSATCSRSRSWSRCSASTSVPTWTPTRACCGSARSATPSRVLRVSRDAWRGRRHRAERGRASCPLARHRAEQRLERTLDSSRIESVVRRSIRIRGCTRARGGWRTRPPAGSPRVATHRPVRPRVSPNASTALMPSPRRMRSLAIPCTIIRPSPPPTVLGATCAVVRITASALIGAVANPMAAGTCTRRCPDQVARRPHRRPRRPGRTNPTRAAPSRPRQPSPRRSWPQTAPRRTGSSSQNTHSPHPPGSCGRWSRVNRSILRPTWSSPAG